MANGTLAQKEWVVEAVIESTEEIPARMRERLIALEDSIGSSMRKALKEKLDVQPTDILKGDLESAEQ